MAKHTNIRDLVDSFTADIEALIRDEIRRGFDAALGFAGTPRPTVREPSATSPAGKAAPARRKKGQKRTPEEILAVKETLRSYIAKNPGQGIEAIGKGLGVPTKELTRPASQLIAAKSIRTTGQKRATKYFAK